MKKNYLKNMKHKMLFLSLAVVGAVTLIAYTNATVFSQGVRCDEFVAEYYSGCQVPLPANASNRQYLQTTLSDDPDSLWGDPHPRQTCPFTYSDPGVSKFGSLECRTIFDGGIPYIPLGNIRCFAPIYHSPYKYYIKVVLKKGNQYCISDTETDELLNLPNRALSSLENIRIQKAFRSLAGTDNQNYSSGTGDIIYGPIGNRCFYSQGHLTCKGFSKYLYDYYRNVNIPNAQQFCTKAYNCLLGRSPDTNGLNSCVNDVNQNRAGLFAANMASSSEFTDSLRYRRWMDGDLSGCTASNPPPPPAPTPPHNPPPQNTPPPPPPPNSCNNGYWRLSACNNQCSHSCARKPGCGSKWYCQ